MLPPSGQDGVLQSVWPNVSTQEERWIQYQHQPNQQQSGMLVCVWVLWTLKQHLWVQFLHSSLCFYRNLCGATAAQQSHRFKALVMSWFYTLLNTLMLSVITKTFYFSSTWARQVVRLIPVQSEDCKLLSISNNTDMGSSCFTSFYSRSSEQLKWITPRN